MYVKMECNHSSAREGGVLEQTLEANIGAEVDGSHDTYSRLPWPISGIANLAIRSPAYASSINISFVSGKPDNLGRMASYRTRLRARCVSNVSHYMKLQHLYICIFHAHIIP